jgi:hypothetical protein
MRSTESSDKSYPDGFLNIEERGNRALAKVKKAAARQGMNHDQTTDKAVHQSRV